MTGCVRDPPWPSGASSQQSSQPFGESALRSTTTKLKSSLLAPPLSLSAPPISMGAAGTGQPISSFLARQFGTTGRCKGLLGRRVAKARALLAAVGKFPDAQGALLRSCSGLAVPPDSQPAPFRTADTDIRAAVAPSLMTTGALRPWASPLGGARCQVTSRHAPATSQVSPLAGSVSCGRLLIFPTLTTCVTCLLPRTFPPGCHSLRAVTPSGPTFMLRVTPPPRSPCPARWRPNPCPASFATPLSPGTVVCTSRLAPLSGRLATPPPHAKWDHDSACGKCCEVLGRPRPLLLLWRRQGPPPPCHSQRRLLGGRRIHLGFT